MVIRHAGRPAEEEFARLVQFARRTDNQKKGDFIVKVDGKDHYVEVKKCDSNTINQVRAIKYIALVVYAPKRKCWYVVPPNALVRLIAQKPRGQHTEIPFESANLSVSLLDKEGFRCSGKDLPEKVADAIQAGEKDRNTERLMKELLEELGNLSSRYKEKLKYLNA